MTRSPSEPPMKEKNLPSNRSELLSLISTINKRIFHGNSCRIEVYGGFEGPEISYISGTLFVDIAEMCSCYLHYQPLHSFALSEMGESGSIGRIVWCVLGCPSDVIGWCSNVSHRLYCEKFVILFDLFDEGLNLNIDHYQYFAGVYRNYLRHDSGNHLTYLTKDLRKLLKVKHLKPLHRVLNWTLAIEIEKEEWKRVGFDVHQLVNLPSSSLLSEINDRIVSRILVKNEKVEYHSWPDLDRKLTKSPSNGSVVFWFPIGFAMNYLYSAVQSSVAPTSHRKQMWSWLGSMKLDERDQLINRLQSNDSLAHHISQQGYLYVIGGNQSGLIYMDYTAQLLESQFIPLPRGYSPEQYRSSEAIESGAIPIVNEQWVKMPKDHVLQPLAYLNILGYDPPTLTTFEHFPERLIELSRLPSHLLDHWQSVMLTRHRILMKTLTKHIATLVCATTSSNGLSRERFTSS